MHPKALADLHARAFAHQRRAWSTQEFTDLLKNGAFQVTHPHGFAIGRTVADETELLTIVIDPDHQKKGHGQALLQAFEAKAQAHTIFLEVAETNSAARALYAKNGYQQVARRPDYYKTPSGKIAALILRKQL